MAIENTSLMMEVNAITNSGIKPVHYRWRAEVLANGERIQLYKIMSIDNERDYAANFTDECFLEFIMPAGQYYYYIFPYKENLLVTVYKEPITEISKARILDKETKSQPFRAVLVDDSSPVVENNQMSSSNAATMDLNDPTRRVRFQLMDLATEQLRVKTVGTVVENQPPGDALRYLLTKVSKEILVENVAVIEGVDIYPPDNTEPYKQLVIPHDKPLVDLCGLFQNTAGVYNTGLGSYLQGGIWYVYPLFDHERFDKTHANLTLINMPQNRYSGVERTYRQAGEQVVALVTGDVAHLDLSERGFLTRGNGVRFADPNRLFRGFSVADQNRATATRTEVNNEFRTVDRETGMNYVPFSDQTITANKYAQVSQLAARNGSFLLCVWQNSDPDLIYPGMPVKFLYEANNQVIETQGIVLFAMHRAHSDTLGVFAGGYVNRTTLLLSVKRKIERIQPTGETQ